MKAFIARSVIALVVAVSLVIAVFILLQYLIANPLESVSEESSVPTVEEKP